MKQRARIYYTEAQKALMWEHWKKGNRSSKLPSCSTEITHLYSESLPSLVAFGPQKDSDQDWH